MKKQSGVSLLALAITVIVLLILGGTIISTLFQKNENIMKNAETAVDEYNNKAEAENKVLETFEKYFEQYQ